MPSSSFYAYFVHVLRCSKQVIQTKVYPKKVSKLSYFCKKCKNCFAFLFWDLRPKSQIFTPHPCPLYFENFLLNTLNSEQKPSAKNRLTGPVKNRSTGQSTGDDFEIYRSGRENPDRFHFWSGGEGPSRWAIFCNFLEKEAILIPLDHILHVFRAIWKY